MRVKYLRISINCYIFYSAPGERYGMTIYYIAANEKIEKWTNTILNFSVKIVVALYCIPIMIVSYYRYYVLDLAEKSFFMILPLAYVRTTMS